MGWPFVIGNHSFYSSFDGYVNSNNLTINLERKQFQVDCKAKSEK